MNKEGKKFWIKTGRLYRGKLGSPLCTDHTLGKILNNLIVCQPMQEAS